MSRHLPVPCAFQETLCSQMTHSCSFPGSCPASDHAEPPSHALWGQRSARRAPRRCGNCASPTLGWRGAWSRGRRLQPCVIPHPTPQPLCCVACASLGKTFPRESEAAAVFPRLFSTLGSYVAACPVSGPGFVCLFSFILFRFRVVYEGVLVPV